MKKTLIIYPGGTIGMSPETGGHGLRPSTPGEFEPMLRAALVAAGVNQDLLNFDLIETERLIDSSNAAVPEWNEIGSLIAQNYDGYDGFVVLHGTDTMGYAAASLSFMLENLGKPVVMTGAQKPLIDPETDGIRNVTNALRVVHDGQINEVAVCFDHRLINGTRAFKYSSTELDAFRSVNFPQLAEISGDRIVYNLNVFQPEQAQDFSFFPLDPHGLAIVDVQMVPEVTVALIHQSLGPEVMGRVVIINAREGGNVHNDERIFDAVRDATERGIPVFVRCQDYGGRADCTKGTGLKLVQAGAIPAYDMTSAACQVKALYMLSKGMSVNEMRREMARGFHGEVTACSHASSLASKPEISGAGHMELHA